MNKNIMTFLALALSMLYGVGFVVVGEDQRTGYAAIGGVVVALAWIATSMFGRDRQSPR